MIDLGQRAKGAQENGEAVFDPASLEDRMKLLEHNGDEMVHDAFTQLAKKFVAPIDREDITSLLKALDDMTDFTEQATSRLAIYHIDQATPAIVKFSEIILSQAEAVRKAVLALKLRGAQMIINDAAKKIDELENEGDALLRNTLQAMFEIVDETKASAFQIMKMKEIYESLELATDKAEDVADILRNLLIKYSLW